MADEVVKIAPNLPKDVKTFTFSNEDMIVLNARKAVIDQYSVIINDLNHFIQEYIALNVVPRCGIDIDKYDIAFNIKDGNLKCTPKPPQIIKPDNNIIVPK